MSDTTSTSTLAVPIFEAYTVNKMHYFNSMYIDLYR